MRTLSEKTRKAYEYWTARFIYWCGDNELTVGRAQEFLDKLGERVAPATTFIVSSALKHWFKQQGKEVDFEIPIVHTREPRYVTVDQVALILSNCRTPLEEALVTCLFDGGLRISELLGIETDGIDWQQGLVKVVRKGGYEARVNLSEKALDTLKRLLAARYSRSKLVFMNMDYHTAYSVICDIGHRSGIKLNPHMLRHARAIHMLDNGSPLSEVADHLGHKNINTTYSVYGRFKPVHLRERIPAW